jgi:hypothetical protein
MNSHLVIGFGEIGQAIYTNLKETYPDVYKIDKDETCDKQIDVLHICYPWSDYFADTTHKYMTEYEPELIIIYSTVPIGTTEKFYNAVHSPVEGKHPMLADSVYHGTRYIGGPKKACSKAELIWSPINATVTLPSSKWTEFLKLRSTAKYGINLVWTDYEASVAKELDMPFEYIKQFDSDYNKLYDMLGLGHNKRYILDPPEGKIGGHCVVPNARLLDNKFPSELLVMIMEMGVGNE